MSDQMKPTCAIYVLHSRQVQSFGVRKKLEERNLNFVDNIQYFI